MELKKEIVDKSIEFLKNKFNQYPKLIEQIKEDHAKDSDTWWAPFHFTFGMKVRNDLRENVCLDTELPSGNWDDYYIELIEMALNLKGVK